MKRRIVLILLLLVAGAIVNVAATLAWQLVGHEVYWRAFPPSRSLSPDEIAAQAHSPLIVANAGTLAAAIVAMIWTAALCISLRRIKRGLCPKCAFPVGTNQVCTECGAAVPRKVETSAPQSPNVQSPDS